MKNTSSILLIIGIIVLANLLSNRFFKRFDLTADQQFTLSNATKNILKDLDDPVTVTAYFTEGLGPEFAKTRNDFRDMLVEYANLSQGMVDYEFINPNESEESEAAAQQNGIQPVLISVREKDQTKQQRAYLGAVLKMGEQQDVIPFIQPGSAMEYGLSTSIKKMAVVDKPSVGVVQGYGSSGANELAQVYQSLGILYNVENVDLSTSENIPDRFRTVAIVAPKDSIPPTHLAKLDQFLGRGGNLFVAINTVGNEGGGIQGVITNTGLEGWLRGKGLEVENSYLIDVVCGSVTVPQQRGPFTINAQVQFPYFPMPKDFADHPITKGIEQVIMPFASPLRYVGDSAAYFTPLVFSSDRAGIIQAPTTFEIEKNWAETDFPLSQVTIGGILEGNLVGPTASRIVVIGDGDFPASAQGRGQNTDNSSLMVNSIDWLSDDTGLIELRTKGVASRPLEDLEDSRRSFLKWLNFLLPIGLVIAYGIFRYQARRNRRIRRMQESYA